MTARLLLLHLRTRRAGWIAVLVVVSALLRGILVRWTDNPGPFTTMVSLLLVATAATVIATGLASPFGDQERSAGTPLPRLRLTQLTGATTLAAAAFATAAATSGLSPAEYLRDLAGLTGIALLTAVLLGAHQCWTVPLAYVLACAGEVDLDQHPLWAWPTLPAAHTGAAVLAVSLLLLGSVTAARAQIGAGA